MMSKKSLAIDLRKNGYSVKEISKRIDAAQGSVSTWVREVILSPEQKLKLKNNIHSPEVIEKRRKSRLQNQDHKRKALMTIAADEIKPLDSDALRLIGIALYWGEGAKTKMGVARVTNSDPTLIRMIMRFFREVCQVPEEKFRAHIHIHSKTAVKDAEKYWSGITAISLDHFYKTYCIKSKSSKNKRFSLPHGTLEVAVNDTSLYLKIMGWMEGLRKQTK